MELHQLTATQLRAKLAAGETTAEAIVQSCLAAIADREDRIHAWIHLAGDAALATARAMDAGPKNGLLHGIPVGVKDIIDTADMPTAYGATLYAGHRPPWDATCVSLVRQAGGLVLGKTVSTEFAFNSPGATANPHNPGHTPGGSSSGSAAAVAAKMVPLAFGSQTAGSVIRPASFCGVVGFKPSRGKHGLAGIKTLAHSLDTLGWFARSVPDITLMRSALLAQVQPLGPVSEIPPKIGLCRTAQWDEADPSSRRAVEAAAEAFAAAGARVRELDLPAEFDGYNTSQQRLMNYEVARALAYEHFNHGGEISDVLRATCDEGLATSEADYEAARDHGRAGRRAFGALMADVDILLTPSAPGEAPAGLQATGDPKFNRTWTLLGVPALNLPGLTGPKGLPVGVQFIGTFGRDLDLLKWGHWAEGLLAEDRLR